MCGRVIQSSGPLRYGIVEGIGCQRQPRQRQRHPLIEEEEEEDADVTDIIGGDIQNKEEG